MLIRFVANRPPDLFSGHGDARLSRFLPEFQRVFPMTRRARPISNICAGPGFCLRPLRHQEEPIGSEPVVGRAALPACKKNTSLTVGTVMRSSTHRCRHGSGPLIC